MTPEMDNAVLSELRDRLLAENARLKAELAQAKKERLCLCGATISLTCVANSCLACGRLDAEISWRQEIQEALYHVVHSVNWKNWPAISRARARMQEAAALVPDYDEPEETGRE